MRRFEFSDSTSNKFWEVEVKGKTLNVTFGKIGTKGQSKPKDFATPEKASAEMEKLIKEKTGKGYVEVGGKAVKAEKSAAVMKSSAGSMEEGLSKAEKQAKAEEVLLMFADGQWESAQDILKAAKDEPWLFEELLNDCKIKDGEIKHSAIVQKYFENIEYGNADMVILSVLLESPVKITKLLKLDPNKIKVIHCIPSRDNLEYFGFIHERYPDIKQWDICPENDVAEEIVTLSDSAAKLLSYWDMEVVSFEKLENLSDKAIGYLCSPCPEYLTLPALKSLSGGAAKLFLNLLKRNATRVNLDGLINISDEAVKIISKSKFYHPDDDLDGLVIPEKLQKIVEEFKEKQPKKK